ncbi:hypothetical protein C2845_PM02G15820 [Panicum miliaceum]|uniref:F-box domain-containing protein n=1 Tax=Panicum miliaceum TaxID=4540 RepID=A0A3L6SBE8_PANMI|nr:hypothetical protein C2845_PM02G15820 [Panicum miliaceum]
MPAAAAAPPPDDDAASPRWHDLPLDLVGDIAGRLHAATDYVRFHSVSQPWRHTLPPTPCRPAPPPSCRGSSRSATPAATGMLAASSPPGPAVVPLPPPRYVFVTGDGWSVPTMARPPAGSPAPLAPTPSLAASATL